MIIDLFISIIVIIMIIIMIGSKKCNGFQNLNIWNLIIIIVVYSSIIYIYIVNYNSFIIYIIIYLIFILNPGVMMNPGIPRLTSKFDNDDDTSDPIKRSINT